MELKENNKPVILQDDIFENSFNEFQMNSISKRLEQKYEVKPYWKRFKLFRKTVLWASYLFNFVSGVGACSLVFFFISQLAAPLGLIASSVIASVVTLAAIGLLEYVKRFLNGTIIKDGFQFKKFRFGFAAMALIVSGMSITSTFFGGQRAIVELTPPPELVKKDSMESVLQEQIAVLDTRITNAENTKWMGTTTREGSKARTEFQKEKALLTARLIEIQKSVEDENGVVLMEHKSEVGISALSFAWASVGFELLFLICIFYLEYYDYRSITEFAVMGVAGQVQNVEVVSYKVGEKDQNVAANVASNVEEIPAPQANNKALPNVAENVIDNVAQRSPNSVATKDQPFEQLLLLEDVTVLEAALSNAKSNRSAFKSKLKNNVGKKATNEAGFNKWNGKVESIEKRIDELS